MKLYGLIIYDKNHNMIYNNYNLSDFPSLYKTKIKRCIELIIKDLMNNLEPNNYYKFVENNEYCNINIYCERTQGYKIIITAKDFDEESVLKLIDKLNRETNFNKIFNSYENKNYKIENENSVTEIPKDYVDLLESSNIIFKTAPLENSSSVYIEYKENECCIIF